MARQRAQDHLRLRGFFFFMDGGISICIGNIGDGEKFSSLYSYDIEILCLDRLHHDLYRNHAFIA